MHKPLILVVDDEPQVLRAIGRDLLARYGRDYRVLRAGGAGEATDVLRQEQAAARPVALILSDQRMPGMDGVSLLAEARRLVPTAKRALLTAYADTDAAIAAINRSQVDYYLQKPWDPPGELLYPIVDDLLDDWKASYKPGWGGVRLAGSRWLPGVHALREFLSRNHIPYEFFDTESSDARGDEARRLVEGASAFPVVFTADGERLEAPGVSDVARRVGLRTEARESTYDVAIVGAGPAGLAAAVYAASEGLSTVLLDREAPGGQAGTSSLIENYLGFPSGLSGQDLARRALTQARRFDVDVLTPVDVRGLRIDGPFKHLEVTSPGPSASGLDTAESRSIACKALVLTTGLAWQRLTAECAERFEGRGIYYGASSTEARTCGGETVYVVGAGNSAGQAALNLAQYATRVVILARCRDLGEKMSRYLVDRIATMHGDGHGSIEVRTRTEVAGCRGSDRLEGLTLRHCDTGAEEAVEARFLFVFIGATPRTDWLGDQVARDARGYILTGPDLDGQAARWPLTRAPFMLEASVPGIFAAGDVRHESIKRVATAVGEGAVSIHFIHRYLASL
jgi:thioredoxin reductase (NADPH)